MLNSTLHLQTHRFFNPLVNSPPMASPPSPHLQLLLIVRRVREEEAKDLSHTAGRKEANITALVVQDEWFDERGSDGSEGRGQGTLSAVTLTHEFLTGLQHIREMRTSFKGAKVSIQ